MRISKNKLGLSMLNSGVDSIKDLAEASGVSINTISRCNNGGTVKLATLRKLAMALNVDPSELLEEV
jgi:DNA-binding Xre family transcriptional regulator